MISLDGIPVGKGRPRFSRATGHAYTPAKTRQYETTLAYAAQVVMTGRPLLEGALMAEVVALFPIPASYSKSKRLDALSGALRPTKKPDADNLVKTLDALNGIVFRDDSQIVVLNLRKAYAAKPGFRVRVTQL